MSRLQTKKTPSVREALRDYKISNGLPWDEAGRKFWSYKLGPLTVWLPNFAWRKKAIAAHDLHHLITGYPCSIQGECQMAAWEFGAGPMPHWAASWFCLPLIPLGLLISPRLLWRAHVLGRRARSLHGTDISDALLAAPMTTLRARQTLSGQLPGRADYLSFATLIVWSVIALVGPFAAIAVGLLAIL
ncbi:hypothetical protein [Pelagibius sp. Alg239-R121]|uniref:hypothetical protein n=1 Tax=Pelagibius sp. Alg239-R121 TaxID=2993448 RepID=UPI0024A72B04|nr:hypothetical protein [Pelagibius sp. Alg239-R121]